MADSSELIGKKILVLTAHPDDESFLAAGTLYQNKQAGGETILVCATLGEKGTSHLKEPMTEEQLKKVRHDELNAAAGVIGIKTIHELRYPDGKVNEHEQEIFEQTSKLIEETGPEIIMSFGPDGITGHKDHIAAGRAAAKLAQHHGLPLVIFCLPKETIAEAEQWLKSRRATPGHYEDDWTWTEGNITIAIDPNIKLEALKKYVSQTDSADPFASYPAHIAEAISKTESFYFTPAG